MWDSFEEGILLVVHRERQTGHVWRRARKGAGISSWLVVVEASTAEVEDVFAFEEEEEECADLEDAMEEESDREVVLVLLFRAGLADVERLLLVAVVENSEVLPRLGAEVATVVLVTVVLELRSEADVDLNLDNLYLNKVAGEASTSLSSSIL